MADKEKPDKGEGLKALKQSRLPGLTNGKGGGPIKKVQEVEDAANKWDAKVKERMEMTKDEVKLHDALLTLMEKHKIPEYRLGNTIFRRTEGKRKVKRVRVTDEDQVQAEENAEAAE